MLNTDTNRVGQEWTARQGEVLEAALGLLVDAGDRLTMSAVARAASCSKETLYNWFGDREGLLTAIVQWQAAKVGIPRPATGDLDAAQLRERLVEFARNLLGVLSSDTSVALNRVAIGHGSNASGLGQIVLENGRRSMGRRLKPVLEAGRDAGLLSFTDSETAFRTFFGLVVRDVQVRRLLGDDLRLSADDVAADVQAAVDQFFLLYGLPDGSSGS